MGWFAKLLVAPTQFFAEAAISKKLPERSWTKPVRLLLAVPSLVFLPLWLIGTQIENCAPAGPPQPTRFPYEQRSPLDENGEPRLWN